MITQVYKTIRVCPCGKEYTYFRLPGELGRSQGYCTAECADEQLKNRLKSRELVDILDIPKEWQKRLEQKLARPTQSRAHRRSKR